MWTPAHHGPLLPSFLTYSGSHPQRVYTPTFWACKHVDWDIETKTLRLGNDVWLLGEDQLDKPLPERNFSRAGSERDMTKGQCLQTPNPGVMGFMMSGFGTWGHERTRDEILGSEWNLPLPKIRSYSCEDLVLTATWLPMPTSTLTAKLWKESRGTNHVSQMSELTRACCLRH